MQSQGPLAFFDTNLRPDSGRVIDPWRSLILITDRTQAESETGHRLSQRASAFFDINHRPDSGRVREPWRSLILITDRT